jgi:hypothetical protein
VEAINPGTLPKKIRGTAQAPAKFRRLLRGLEAVRAIIGSSRSVPGCIRDSISNQHVYMRILKRLWVRSPRTRFVAKWVKLAPLLRA